MAFGKNPSAMNISGSFRQMSGQLAKNTYEKRTKGSVPAFLDEYKPDSQNIDTIRLIQGEYLQNELHPRDPATLDHEPDEKNPDDNWVLTQTVMPLVKFTSHFDGFNEKGTICSAGPWRGFRDKRKACHGCDIYLETLVRQPSGRWESSRMSQQDKFAVSLWDYGNYHKLAQIDRETGKEKINPRTKEPYFNWVKCLGQVCDACRAQAETVQGSARHWPLTWTQLQVLRSAELDIGKSCTTCSGVDTILSLGWECPHCGECAIDMGTTTLKQEEITKLTGENYQCTSCNVQGFLQEVYECKQCAQTGKQGVRASLFDVDLRVKVVPMQNPDGSKGKGKSLQVMGWSVPYVISPELAEKAKPIDLVARYAPDPLERQAERFGVTTAPQGPRREPQTGAPSPQGGAPATGAPAGQPGGPRTYANPYAPRT